MKILELRAKTVDQLSSLLLDLKKESFNLRFQKVSGELAKTSRVRDVRRTIARVNTLLNSIANNKKTSGGANA
jgi:large subunit ribosomal protein L29